MMLSDIEKIVGENTYTAYGPETRLRREANKLLSWKNLPENERIKDEILNSMQRLYNLCTAYLIGANINNAPNEPAFTVYKSGMASIVRGEANKKYYVDQLMKDANKCFFCPQLKSEQTRFSEFIISELLQSYTTHLFPKNSTDTHKDC